MFDGDRNRRIDVNRVASVVSCAASFAGWGTLCCESDENAIIGAHSFVNQDVPAGVTVVGVPAKPLQKE